MTASAGPQESIDRLRRRLALHALWRSALVFLPPLLAAWYIVLFLYRFHWLGPDAVMLSGATLLIAAAALTAARSRAHATTPLLAARLIDEKAAAEDRFVTLATLAPAGGPPEFFSQLNSEAAALARTIDFKKDFPFHIERAILNSIIAALAAVLLFQLVFEFAPPPSGAKLADAAAKLAGDPRFADVVAALSGAAAKLAGASLSEGEKQAMLADVLGQVEERIAAEKARGGDAAALEAVAAELRQMDKNQNSSRFRLPWMNEPGEESGSGAGNSGQGNGNGGAQKLHHENAGGGGEKQSGKKSPGGSQRGEKAEEPRQGSLNRSSTGLKEDARQVKGGGETEGSKAGMQKGDAEGGERSGGAAAKDDLQRDGADRAASGDKPPARFAAPGEKLSGDLKDLRTVIVRLPDEGEAASGTREGQRKAPAGALPGANVPLAPPAGAQAAQEKQMLPLEYRGMIR